MTLKEWMALNQEGTTESQRSVMPHRDKAKKIVCQMVRDALSRNFVLWPDSPYGGLTKEDAQRIHDEQPVHLYISATPQWFSKNDIKAWGSRFFGRMREAAAKGEGKKP